jgi:YkoY family integral membrane protein
MDFLHQIFGADLQQAALIILNLVVIESLLSVDNAAVLATMVLDLPKAQRARALRYGILGAYAFRGLALLFATWLVAIWWLKPLGGLYLLYLAYSFFANKADDDDNDDVLDKNDNWLYRSIVGAVGTFWATVALVELMDMAFSIDNVLAVVVFTDNIYMICIGVFIGILAMRFVAQIFVQLMERYPFLESVAFAVLAVLGLKLLASLPCHFYPDSTFAKLVESERADMYMSLVTVLMFVIPVLTSWLFNVPKRNTVASDAE